MPAAPATKRPVITVQQLLDQFQGRIEPAPLSIGYRVGLVLVAILMLVLPLIYVAMIAGVVWFVFLYAVNGLALFGSTGARAALIGYLGPLLLGGTLVVFMVKPLLRRRWSRGAEMELRRKEHPLLFEYVEHLCEMIGSPAPARITVDCQPNASASFRRGLLSFFGTDLCLTIGLPLASGLNLRQFTGVLAHEFGHFSQETAMRVSYVVRSINAWFASVVYEPDSIDEWLMRLGHQGGGIKLFALPARALIWITRRVLWCLMVFGHIVSAFLLRQMEFDADRYEARVAGSAAFAETARKLPLLSVAWQGVFSDLEDAWRARTACDDMPAMVVANLERISAEAQKKIHDVVEEARTGFFDTHPSDTARIRNAQAENAAGTITIEAPAAILFSHFSTLSRRATDKLYRTVLGPMARELKLVPTRKFYKGRVEEVEESKSLYRFCQGCFSVWAPMFPDGFGTPPASVEHAKATLERARASILQFSKGEAKATRDGLQKAERQIGVIRLARAMKAAGAHAMDAKTIGLTSVEDRALDEQERQAKRDTDEAASKHARFNHAVLKRMSTALAVAQSAPSPLKGVEPMETQRLEELLAAATAVRMAFPVVRRITRLMPALHIMIEVAANNPGIASLTRQAERLTEEMGVQLRVLFNWVAGPVYPFEGEQPGQSIADYSFPKGFGVSNPAQTLEAAEMALDRLNTMHLRIMGVLARRAEQVEESLGLPAMPEAPEPEPEKEESN
ncbi:MAG: M48 family metallopeptidase [Tepidisphaerales bacterium]